jgi:TRAP-type mannitol/chloroaromatic compound transport system permease large subunit
MSNETLLAIPFFTFMGVILERSRMAEELLDNMGQLFGSIRGGLAYAVIFVGALLAATTGVIAASVIAMGLISLPIMLRYGYDNRVATGVIVSSGALVQIVPPSMVLIVLADQLGLSVGNMYTGALLPAFILILSYVAYIYAVSLFRPTTVPALPPEAITLGTGMGSLLVTLVGGCLVAYIVATSLQGSVEQGAFIYGAAAGVGATYLVAVCNNLLKLGILSHLAETIILSLTPTLALIFIVLGTILVGIATPTEGGAMGAVGALILAAAKGRLRLETVRMACESTLRLSAFVIFILIGARVFSLTFYGVDGHIWVEHLLLALPGGELGFLLIVGLVIFVLGFFLDFFEIVFIVVPLLIAPAKALGIDLVWFGILIAVCLQTSFLTPPFGFALFYLRSVTPTEDYTDRVTGRLIRGVTTFQMYRGALPFIAIQIVAVIFVLMVPQTVTHYRSNAELFSKDEVEDRLDNLEFPSFDFAPPSQ